MTADHGCSERHARAHRAALSILIALGTSGSGCAPPISERASTHVDRGQTKDAGPLPEEERSITLTLFPFHEIPLDENGFGTPLPLGGVEVCVAYRRPYSGVWNDFTATNGPCRVTKEGENLVLPGVPGLSELMVTATKQGYRPAVFAVTTGPDDLDVTVPFHAADTLTFHFSLTPSDAQWAGLSDVPVKPDGGNLWLYPVSRTLAADASTFGRQGVDIKFLGGARVSLAPPAGNGPFYFIGGVASPGAMHTVPGAFDVEHTWAGAAFVNLPEGEYEVNVDHPTASCSVAGAGGTPVSGYARARDGGVILAPVLAGFSTEIIAACLCRRSLDARTCGAPDSGAP